MSDNEQSGPFGGLSASEAGKRSWEARRQRAAEVKSAESNGVGIVVTDAETDEIIRALRDKAKRGDVPAARELREWVDKKAHFTQRAAEDKAAVARRKCEHAEHELLVARAEIEKLRERLARVQKEADRLHALEDRIAAAQHAGDLFS